MNMDELEARTQTELADIVAVLTEMTGLPSRWSGRAELVPGANFRGKKRFICDIQISADLADQDARWTTLIHEALHAVSTGYIREDYQDFQGWEEGVVEQLQRLLRARVLSHLRVTVDPQVLHRLDEEHAYNKYIAALETIREAQDISVTQAEAFYLELIGTPIKNRQSHVSRYGFSLPPSQRVDFFAVVSAASAMLRTRNR